MAEGFEVYHVPQQSRRDKLRVGICSSSSTPIPTNSTSSTTHNISNNNNFNIAAAGLLPLYDPSSLISSSDHHFDFHPLPQNPSFQLPHHNINYPFTPTAAAVDQPLSLELNLQQRYASAAAAVFSPHDPPPHSPPLPLLGYSAALLKGSKFFKPAHQLLHDLFDFAAPPNSDKLPSDSVLVDPLLESLGGDIPAAAADHDPITSVDDATESRRKKSRLITMLDEVYRRYKLYYQQMQAVVTTFEYAAGLGNAAPYVNLAVKAMFKHFRFLKNAIADQLQFNKQQQQQQPPPYNPYCQRSMHNNNAGFLDHQPVWRPQRGLPESAVTVLRAWLFEHFLHPYPTDTDKLMLANQTGLSRSQVSNWFINARVRLWKPMVEEIHMLETRQAQKSHQREANNNNGNGLNNNDHNISSTNESLKVEHNNNNNNASSSNHDHHSLDLSNSNFFATHHPHAAAGAATMGGGNVSLTLGLHQNHGGITLTEPFPINAAQHFNLGLEANGDQGFVNEWF